MKINNLKSKPIKFERLLSVSRGNYSYRQKLASQLCTHSRFFPSFNIPYSYLQQRIYTLYIQKINRQTNGPDIARNCKDIIQSAAHMKPSLNLIDAQDITSNFLVLFHIHYRYTKIYYYLYELPRAQTNEKEPTNTNHFAREKRHYCADEIDFIDHSAHLAIHNERRRMRRARWQRARRKKITDNCAIIFILKLYFNCNCYFPWYVCISKYITQAEFGQIPLKNVKIQDIFKRVYQEYFFFFKKSI